MVRPQGVKLQHQETRETLDYTAKVGNQAYAHKHPSSQQRTWARGVMREHRV
jgi:hypothetical protein